MTFFDTVRYENILVEVSGIQPFLVGAAINAADETWYDFQKTITTQYTCVVNAESGRVRYVSEDASTISPGVGERAFGVDSLPDEFFDFEFNYWMFDGEKITPHIPTVEEFTLEARKIRNDFILATDPLVIADYSINDVYLSQEQREELFATRLDFKRWPSQPGWPDIPLPAVPAWISEELIVRGYMMPAWPQEG